MPCRIRRPVNLTAYGILPPPSRAEMDADLMEVIGVSGVGDKPLPKARAIKRFNVWKKRKKAAAVAKEP